MRYLIFIVILMFTACKSSKKSTTIQNVAPDDYLSLERSGCYGTCPIYQVKIYGNGTVQYIGERHVDNVGSYSSQLNQMDIHQLFQQASLAKWESYPEKYPIDNVDFPQFRIGYQNEDKTYLIQANSRADEELIALSKAIDLAIANLEWTLTEGE